VLFRFQESAEFEFGISPRTRRDYIQQIKRIERAFGDFPIKALDDPRSHSVFLDWRDQLAQTSLRQADYAYGTLARILSFHDAKSNRWQRELCARSPAYRAQQHASMATGNAERLGTECDPRSFCAGKTPDKSGDEEATSGNQRCCAPPPTCTEQPANARVLGN
jgi:hypothetical protein